MEIEKVDIITKCDDCGMTINEGVITEQDDYFCFDCADRREAEALSKLDDCYYDCREVSNE
jgi:hypothetical protein